MSIFGESESLGGPRRAEGDIDVDIDMVPVMNMFLVLIPFLLMSSSFLHIKAINTSVPVKSETMEQIQSRPSDIAITAVVAIRMDELVLEATSEELDEEQLQKLGTRIQQKTPLTADPSTRETGKPALLQLSQALQVIKSQYPRSDTVILIPEQRVLYDTIVATMDAARQMGETPLFKNLVLSATVQE